VTRGRGTLHLVDLSTLDDGLNGAEGDAVRSLLSQETTVLQESNR
jgi:hypothetical protein